MKEAQYPLRVYSLPVCEVTCALIRIAYSVQVHTQSLSLWLQMADLINTDSWLSIIGVEFA